MAMKNDAKFEEELTYRFFFLLNKKSNKTWIQ